MRDPGDGSGISSDGTVRVELPAETNSVGLARRLTREHWSQLPDDILDDLELIVAELVANAVRHGRPVIELQLRSEPFAVDVAVLDRDPSLPPTAARMPEDFATTGRGLLLVDRLAHRWGVEPHADRDGKTVWARLTT